jgi:transposase InsO family protein
LVFVEYLTKWPEAVAVKDITAKTVAQAFLENIVTRHGAPRELLSDKGTNFMSELFNEICSLVGTYKIHTSSWNPKADGLCERFNKTLGQTLRMYASSHQKDWDKFIPFVLFSYRCAVQESTKESPFFLLYGRQPYLPIDHELRTANPSYVDELDFRDQVASKIRNTWDEVRARIQKAQSIQKQTYDRNARETQLREGDRVRIFSQIVPKGKCKKLLRQWVKPSRIIKISGNDALLQSIDHPRREFEWVHLDRFKRDYSLYIPHFDEPLLKKHENRTVTVHFSKPEISKVIETPTETETLQIFKQTAKETNLKSSNLRRKPREFRNTNIEPRLTPYSLRSQTKLE